MPIPCYLSLEGQTQGTIEGSSKVQGHEGKILVQAVEHLVDIPSNPQNGLPSGKCVLGPMTLSKEVDKSSPKLFQALSQGEQMSSVTLEYMRISPKGTEEKYYTVKLRNAIITRLRTWVPLCLSQENQHLGHMEDLSMTYEAITWTFEPDGIEAEASCVAPRS